MSEPKKKKQDDKADAARLRREAAALEFSATWLKTRNLYQIAAILWCESEKRHAGALESEGRATLAKIERDGR